MTDTLTAQQFDELCRVMSASLKRDDFERVLERYPGKEGPDTCLPDKGAPLEFATSCMNAIKKEGTVLPFLSRVVEQKWKDEKFRSAIVGKVRALVHAESAAQPYAATIAIALGGLTAALAASPSPQCPGPATCAFVRQSRPALHIVIRSLDQFDALKALHDSLHVLQVKGVDWLDEDPVDDTRDLPREVFVDIVARLRDVASAVEARVPGEVVASCRRCHETAKAVTAHITGDDVEQAEYALAELRALFAPRRADLLNAPAPPSEPEIIDEAMFALSRDLPLRALRDLIESGTTVPGAPGQQMREAGEALRRLSEALRARILEHALWQATEMHIRRLARVLASPSDNPNFLGEVFTEWSAIRQNLRTLIDTAPNTPTIDLSLNAALVLYERALPVKGKPAPPGPAPDVRLAEMTAAFEEFRLKASLQFLAVDQALKAEFASLLPLRDSLQALESQVSLFCACL